MGENKLIWAFLAISLIGLILSFLFIGTKLNSTSNNAPVFLIFNTICLLGAAATMFPHVCGHRNLPKELDLARYTNYIGVRLVHGHHKLCCGFQSHEIEYKGKSICAACFGLLLGSILASVISFHHFILGFIYPQTAGYLGIIFSFLGLIYIPILKPGIPLMRTLYNILFVVGFALILIVVDNSGILVYDYLIIGISLFWMYSRIEFSSWGHDQICNQCVNPCKNEEYIKN